MPLQHIACIDDEADILQVARMALELVGGFRISAFSDADEALRELSLDPPDLILMDVMMPVRSGPEVFSVLRGMPEFADVPVIFMTARVQPAERREYIALGGLGVIAKPFDPMVLADEIREIWTGSGRAA